MQTKLLTAETYPNFLRIDQFLLIYSPNEYTNIQTLNCRMTTELTMVSK